MVLRATPRTGSRVKHARLQFAGLLRQSAYSRLAGYADVNDAERLCHDPAFRLFGSEKIWDQGAALASRLRIFETEMLGEEENFVGLTRLNRALLGRVEAIASTCPAVLAMDATEISVYGEQEQSAYKGDFELTRYHPLLRNGGNVGCGLRPHRSCDCLAKHNPGRTNGIRPHRDGHRPLDPLPGLHNPEWRD